MKKTRKKSKLSESDDKDADKNGDNKEDDDNEMETEGDINVCMYYNKHFVYHKFVNNLQTTCLPVVLFV